MRTIFQSQDIAFHTLNFKDAVVLLPIMDELTKMVNADRLATLYESLPEEERNNYQRVWRKNDLHISAESAEKILKVLTDLGFEAQIDLKAVNIEDLTRK